jgi:hypothetical protein
LRVVAPRWAAARAKARQEALQLWAAEIDQEADERAGVYLKNDTLFRRSEYWSRRR